MSRDSYRDENCNAIARLLKDLCSCTENGAWSPDMTTERRKDTFLKSEMTNMSAMRRRILTIAKRRGKDNPKPPQLAYETLQKTYDQLTNIVDNNISSEDSTLKRNIDHFLQSRRMYGLEEGIYEKPITKTLKRSSCGENWSLSKAWKNNNSEFFKTDSEYRRPLIENQQGYLERIDEIPSSKRKRERDRFKEQLRYDKHIKRHIRIRVMLSLRMRRYMKRRLKRGFFCQPQVLGIPPRQFLRGTASVTSIGPVVTSIGPGVTSIGPAVTSIGPGVTSIRPGVTSIRPGVISVGTDVSSFGTASYKHVLRDKISDGAALFDVHEARNSMIELCHDYEDDIDTLDIALRAGNFRSGRLAVEGWWCGRAMAGGARANNGALALHYAAARGCLDCVRLLANTTPDASANTAMDNDVTPVYLAAQEGHLAVLKYLVLEAGGRLDARARDGMLPIHAAAQTGCLDCVKWMITERAVDPNARDGDGATPLHFAASRGHLATVRWLLRHGARLHLDRHGKSPINDAAENHHLECLNVLVAAGANAESKHLSAYKTVHSCACIPGEARCALPNCINASASRSPFYLHAPEQHYREKEHRNSVHSMQEHRASVHSEHRASVHEHRASVQERKTSVHERRGSLPSTGSVTSVRTGPADGLYVNPMQRAASNSVMMLQSSGDDSSACSAASEGETPINGGWYLHNHAGTPAAPAALYQRVRDLFHGPRSPGPRGPAEGQEAPMLTVKAEIHGGGAKESAQHTEQSDSDSGNDGARRDHEYEDIYLPREEQTRRRSSSRDSGRHSRPGSGALIIDYTTKDVDNMNKAYEEVSPIPEAPTKSTIATKLAALTHKAQNFASRISSAAGSRRASVSEEPVVQASASSGVSSGGSSGDEAPPPPPPPPPPAVLEEPVMKPSELKGRNARRGSTASATADEDRPRPPNLVNKQPALPFVPPAFPHNAPDRLIKPSEYLKTITAPCKREEGSAGDRAPPPPPPAPDAPTPPPQPPLSHQPLAAISSAELCAVRLRAPASKTLSAPPPTRSVSLQCLATTNEPFRSAKTDLIEELKMSKDITGIRKLKVERQRRESLQDKETFTEFTKRFAAENFVDQVPERDAAGNIIPAWKRQMLARRAAERARKDLEKELANEAERRRAAAVPAWKRQLLQRREEAESRLRQSLYTPKVEEASNGTTNGNGGSEWRPTYTGAATRAVSIDNITLSTHYDDNMPMRAPSEAKILSDVHCNGHNNMMMNGKYEESKEDSKIIPWRAQLRKTNSKLNLLE